VVYIKSKDMKDPNKEQMVLAIIVLGILTFVLMIVAITCIYSKKNESVYSNKGGH